jgi:hypothetical protein
MISQDISPHWVNEPEIVSHDTVLSRTWDDDFNCTTRTTPHPVINKWTGLILAVADQHFPAYLPPSDGKCMAIARHANLRMMNLSNHTILAIHNQSKKASSLDTHGPLALLQKAILERKPVTLFYSSGTG